jgi:hypothetical protein
VYSTRLEQDDLENEHGREGGERRCRNDPSRRLVKGLRQDPVAAIQIMAPEVKSGAAGFAPNRS